MGGTDGENGVAVTDQEAVQERSHKSKHQKKDKHKHERKHKSEKRHKDKRRDTSDSLKAEDAGKEHQPDPVSSSKKASLEGTHSSCIRLRADLLFSLLHGPDVWPLAGCGRTSSGRM